MGTASHDERHQESYGSLRTGDATACGPTGGPLSAPMTMLELDIVFLVRTGDNVVGRCQLKSPYWGDIHDEACGRFSMAIPRYEWSVLLCALLQNTFLKINVRNEHLLR